MQILAILCHPQPGSYNHAVAERACRALEDSGHQVHFHDLYREAFNPILSAQEIQRRFSFDDQVLAYTQELTSSGGLLIVHPDWWSQPPALLKGWVDRVFRPGVAYEFEGEEFMRQRKIALLGGKRALVLITSDTPEEPEPPLLKRLWLEGVFRYCAIEQAACHILHDFFNLNPQKRAQWLDFVTRVVWDCFGPATQGEGPSNSSRSVPSS